MLDNSYKEDGATSLLVADCMQQRASNACKHREKAVLSARQAVSDSSRPSCSRQAGHWR